MNIVNACRVCLEAQAPLVNILESPLHALFEKVTDIKIVMDGRSHELCLLCHTHLTNTSKLIQKAHESEEYLSSVMSNKMEIKKEIIDKPSNLCLSETEFAILNGQDFDGEMADSLNHFQIKVECNNVYDDMIDFDGLGIVKEEDLSVADAINANAILNTACESDTAGINKLLLAKNEIIPETLKPKKVLKKTIRNSRKRRQGDAQSRVGSTDKIIPNFEVTTGEIIIDAQSRVGATDKIVPNFEVTTGEIIIDAQSRVGATDKIVPNSEVTPGEIIIDAQTSREKDNSSSLKKSKLNKDLCVDDKIEKPFPCSYCDRKFSKKTVLTLHLRKHTGEKPFSCNHCDSKFSRKCILIDHLRLHTGEKPFTCSSCDRKFTHRNTLQNHLKLHTGERPHSCSSCDRKFTQKSDLIRHLRTHTGEKPYTCSYCGRKFTHKKTLKIHLREHTGETPPTCTFCDRKFTQESHLSAHMIKAHREDNYVCSYCNLEFTNKNNLSKHLISHTRELFSCCYCDHKFLSKSSLTNHWKTHSF